MSRTISSWLSGPESAGSDRPAGYPGRRFGLPATGAGSLAPTGRRAVALALDYFIAVGLTSMAIPFGWITREAFQYSTSVRLLIVAVWVLLGVVAVRLFGFTPGQYAVGLKVVALDSPGRQGGVGLIRAVVRGLLIALVIPALFIDADGRGLQDRLTMTAVVRR